MGTRRHQRDRCRSRTGRLVAIGALFAVLASGCGGASGDVDSSAADSDASLPPAASLREPVPAPAQPGRPGALLSATEAAPPVNARAWIVDYHSQSLAGADVGERAMLAIPMVEPPPGGFPLIVWGHASKGVADVCAPSNDGPSAIPLVDSLIAAGYAVVAPDYEGMGAAGTHAYMVGESEGRGMLDAARAATQVKGSGIAPTSPVVVWGYSQGGQAAAFAAQIGPTYAPDVNLKGLAMAAPVSDVDHFVKRSEAWPEQFGLLVTVAYGYAKTYPDLPLDQVFTPAMLADLDPLEEECVQEITGYYNRPIAEMLVRTPREVPAFEKRFAESLVGQTAIKVPVLVVQGNADQIVDPLDTDAMVRRYCDHDVPVSYLVRTGENHNILTDDILIPWTRGRLIGDQPPDNCSENVSSQTAVTGGP